MKKLALYFLTILIFALSLGTLSAFAETSVKGDIFVPTSYLEYLSLNDPLDVSASDGVYAIAESKRIIVFKDGLFKYFDLNAHSISKMSLYSESYALFLSNSSLYSLNIDTGAVNVVKDDNQNEVKISNSFTVFNDVITVNTSSSIVRYKGLVDENGFSLILLLNIGTESKEYTKLAALDETSVFVINGNSVNICTSSNGNNEYIVNIGQTLDYELRYATAGGGNYYATTDEGLIKIPYSAGTAQSAPQMLEPITTAPSDLSAILNPQGVTYYEEKLLICDVSLDAVLCYDLATREFTDFAITANPSADNRISPVACDLQVDNETLYVLDDTKIKGFSEGGFLPAIKTDLPIAKSFAKSGNKLLITGGQNLYSMTVDGKTATRDASTSDYSNIIAMTSSGDYIYFLNGTSESTNSYAEIYSISANDLKNAKNNQFPKTKLITKKLGVGYDLTCDLFGNVYAVILNNYNFSVYKIPANGGEVEELYKTTDAISAVTVDFECNVYALKENNKIIRISPQKKTEEYSITLSQNLPALSAKDIVIIPATDKAYALYDGFVLSLDSSELSIAAPDEIAVPTDYSVNYKDGAKIGKIKANSKIFKVNLEDTLGASFSYIGYETYSLNEEFMVVFSNDKYTLLVNEKLSAIVRTADVELSDLVLTQKSEEKYAVTDTFIYNYPIVADYFKGADLTYNSVCTVLGSFAFNGRDFALVKLNESLGYAPISMLKAAPASDGSPYSFKTLTVGNKEVKVYLDSGLTVQASTLAPYTKIEVYGEENGVYKIAYHGGFAYVSTQGIRTKSYYTVRNVILVSIILLAVVVTFVYIFRRAFLTKQKDN